MLVKSNTLSIVEEGGAVAEVLPRLRGLKGGQGLWLSRVCLDSTCSMLFLMILKGRCKLALVYCVKCKQKTEQKDARRVNLKNGKPALRGLCTVCGTTTTLILPIARAPAEADEVER